MKRHSRIWVLGLSLACLVCAFCEPTHAQRGPTPEGGPQQGADSRRHVRPRLAPDWIPLGPDHRKYLDQVLTFWEHRSGKIKTYACKFTRWEYKSQFGPKDWWTTPATISNGVIKYARPDKGMFKVERIQHYTLPVGPDGKPMAGGGPTYEERKREYGEHWICDGTTIFEFAPSEKELREMKLPPDQQGAAIMDGPLPFMFGANTEKLKSRYWMRIVTPKDAEGEYWIEAVPRTRQDTADFKKAEIILDKELFLPTALQLYQTNGKDRTVFQFSARKVDDIWEKFKRDFSRPQTPNGWKRIVENCSPGASHANTGPPDRIRPRQVERLPDARPTPR